jgi:hypothetical protein
MPLKTIATLVLFCAGPSYPTQTEGQTFTHHTVIALAVDRSLMVLAGTPYPLTKGHDGLFGFGRPDISGDATFNMYTSGTVEIAGDIVHVVYSTSMHTSIPHGPPMGTTARLTCREWNGE